MTRLPKTQNFRGGVRSSNIELFRILSMLMIVAHHYVVNSGLLDCIEKQSQLGVKDYFLLLFGWGGKTGITVSYETYQLDVERAEKAPASRNDIFAKRFGIPMEGYTYFFPYEETLPHRHRSFWQMPCALGADLSQGDDFCAFTFLFPLEHGYFGVKTRDYITSYTLSKLPMAMRQKYDEFMREGTLVVMEGTVLDMMEVYDDLDGFIENVGYHCTNCCSAAGAYQSAAERHGQEPAAHREHYRRAAGDCRHHEHRGADRLVEEQLLHQGGHCSGCRV